MFYSHYQSASSLSGKESASRWGARLAESVSEIKCEIFSSLSVGELLAVKCLPGSRALLFKWTFVRTGGMAVVMNNEQRPKIAELMPRPFPDKNLQGMTKKGRRKVIFSRLRSACFSLSYWILEVNKNIRLWVLLASVLLITITVKV